MSEKTVFEILMDENDMDNIVLLDEEGDEIEFEQIATLSLDGNAYCILHPVNLPDMEDDVAVVFLMNDDDSENEVLTVVEDESLIERIFEAYYTLSEE